MNHFLKLLKTLLLLTKKVLIISLLFSILQKMM